MLKADRNAITQLTPAIGSCHALTEIYLTENLLTVSYLLFYFQRLRLKCKPICDSLFCEN